jgi:glucose/arabinose dehydrogenase
LLSIAFAPDYATRGLFYVFYNSIAGNGDIHISEFRHLPGDPDHADPYSERILLTIVKPWDNHNGGMLQFGPDGYLYASVGDGDSGVLHPPGFFAQHKDASSGRSCERSQARGPLLSSTIRERAQTARSSEASSSAIRALRRSQAATCTGTSARGRSPPSPSRTGR